MSLVYATDLNLVHRVTGRPASLESAAALVAAWAGVDALVEGIQPGPSGSVNIEILESETACAWQLILAHSDRRDKSLQWSVSVTLLADTTTTMMATRLEQARSDGSVVLVRTDPRPPGCIRAVLDDPEICAVDGGRPLSSEAWVVYPEHAHALAKLILHPDRKLPIVAYTPRDEDVFDGGLLAKALPGLAHTVLVLSTTSWKLQDLIPKGFGVYGGAARIWWPHIRSDAEEKQKWDHKLWAGDVAAHRISEECTDFIITAGLQAARIETPLAVLQGQRRIAEISRVRAEVEAAVRSQEADRFQKELDQFEALARSYEAEKREAQTRASQAESDLQYWKGEAARQRTQKDGHPVEEVAETDLLRAEIEREANGRGIIDGARRRSFDIGPQFAATVQQHGDRYRGKIVRACADVVLNAPELLRRADDHALRTGDGGSNPAIQRSDGAVARRCSIEQNTPAARRVHYWILPGGSIEFASINVHDDASIPGL